MNTKLLEQFKKGEVILRVNDCVYEEFKSLCKENKINYGMMSDSTNSVLVYTNIYDRMMVANAVLFTKYDFKQTFTKDDLKVGMIVELRNGVKCLVKQFNYIDINSTRDFEPKYYYNDLTRMEATSAIPKQHDIVKVYTTNNLISVLEGNYDSLELIWERDAEMLLAQNKKIEECKMAVEQVEHILKTKKEDLNKEIEKLAIMKRAE